MHKMAGNLGRMAEAFPAKIIHFDDGVVSIQHFIYSNIKINNLLPWLEYFDSTVLLRNYENRWLAHSIRRCKKLSQESIKNN